jgi:hypothetical protein
VHEPDHRHDWGPRRRRDECHYIVIERECRDCREIVVDDHEPRDFDDFNEIVFAREDCARCRELLTGREPASWSKGEPHAQPSS